MTGMKMGFLWVISVQHLLDNYSIYGTSIQFPCSKWSCWGESWDSKTVL